MVQKLSVSGFTRMVSVIDNIAAIVNKDRGLALVDLSDKSNLSNDVVLSNSTNVALLNKRSNNYILFYADNNKLYSKDITGLTFANTSYEYIIIENKRYGH